ncbi:RHS repeat domain-containing protein [Bradyrhizobium sp. 215_C5_N1_1]|uniref:RHS repeat domain-containing protein n=1 Tax=unclassified Bradyrhizobium TaxID=2631580 RepID=UPI003F8982BC
MKWIVIAAVLLVSGAAVAQQRQLYDAAGRNAGRAVTDSQGTTTIYDAAGRVTARSSISGNTTTIYDAAGRRTGAISK